MGPVTHSLAVLTAAAGLPVALTGLALRPAWRVGVSERLGRHPGGELAGPGRAPVWVHGASVGEIRAALPLLDALVAQGRPAVTSAMTVTGRDLCRSLRPAVACGLAPLDHPWTAARALRRVSPAALLLIETELWPFWIAAAARADIPVLVASARISDRSLPRYRRLRRLLRPTLERLSAVGARSAADAERFISLGIPPERVHVTGDLKLEPGTPPELAPELRAVLGSAPLFVAGSTHEGEEQAALAALQAAESAGHELALALAPRRVDRADALADWLEASGRTVRRRSRLEPGPLAPGQVLLLDSFGELSSLYAHARVAFVGGSLVPVGGHNLLEPLHQGCPVVFGPHTESAREATRLALSGQIATRVDDAAGLAAAIVQTLADPAGAAARAARGRELLETHRGACVRTLALLEQVERARGQA